jgi:cytochrome P450
LIALTQVTTPHAVYITSSPAAAQAISLKSDIFLKPTGMFRYQAVNIFGPQMVSCQTGPEHRRHKNVVKGCFNDKIMQEVWETMSRAVETMIYEEEVEKGGV